LVNFGTLSILEKKRKKKKHKNFFPSKFEI
jgi:hypothetical protein